MKLFEVLLLSINQYVNFEHVKVTGNKKVNKKVIELFFLGEKYTFKTITNEISTWRTESWSVY